MAVTRTHTKGYDTMTTDITHTTITLTAADIKAVRELLRQEIERANTQTIVFAADRMLGEVTGFLFRERAAASVNLSTDASDDEWDQEVVEYIAAVLREVRLG